MLYKKNSTKELSKELFKNPTAEYRGTPFWAWNTQLNQEELNRQLEIFREMGFGGAHMHVRTGMSTQYLSDDFMSLIKGCTDKAKSMDMLSWLYDEDRWPSGAAGGIVTKDYKNRARCLLLTTTPCDNKELEADDIDSRSLGGRNGLGNLICCYDVILDKDGCLEKYKKINIDDAAEGTKWFAYLKIHSNSSWYNNQSYADTLSKSAISKFIEVTHERYKEIVGDDFDKAIPSIFTDEPQFTRKTALKEPFSTEDLVMPWTDDVPETFKNEYNFDILDFLPEIFWELKNNKVSKVRYFYHDHICQRFTEAFADNIGEWCSKNNIALTGHMMEEPTLNSQTRALGEAMRSYRSFGIPGIDMLCANFEFTTAKQTQSAVHQYGYEAMLSELYGVTGWDYDFRGYKLHGDWQAALGVTVRVPHLSWVAMGGEAKRDYPASISYQSPWYKKWNYLEDHFARVNTLMTRGTPICKIGVIHPIESFWLHYGPDSQTKKYRESIDEEFIEFSKYMLNSSLDYEYISESLLPDQCKDASSPLKVGKMEYDVIIVPGCESLRSTTINILEKFKNDGGKLIFAGRKPTVCDGVESSRCDELYNKSICIPLEKDSIVSCLEENRTIWLKNEDNSLSNGFIYQLREDNDGKNLFISRCCEPNNKNESVCHKLIIEIKGEYSPVNYDTINGEIYDLAAEYINGNTVIRYNMFEYDSLLLKLKPGKSTFLKSQSAETTYNSIIIPDSVDYSLSEKNVILIDMVEFALDDEGFSPKEEILRLDNVCRNKLNWKERGGQVAQPWSVPADPTDHSITLRYQFESEIDCDNILLAVEDADNVDIEFNGEKVKNEIIGWYVDKDIKTVNLPGIKKGINTLTVRIPFGKRSNTEWMYILGDFGVKLNGNSSVVVEKPKKLNFGDITKQGFPFYGGNVTYKIPFVGSGKYKIQTKHYVGTLIDVKIDEINKGNIVYPPYDFEFETDNGEHLLELTLYGNRANSFGPVHRTVNNGWIGPGAWRTSEEEWSYDYCLKQIGIIEKPKS